MVQRYQECREEQNSWSIAELLNYIKWDYQIDIIELDKTKSIHEMKWNRVMPFNTIYYSKFP